VAILAGIAFDRHARVLAIFWWLPISVLNSEALLLYGALTASCIVAGGYRSSAHIDQAFDERQTGAEDARHRQGQAAGPSSQKACG